MMCRMNGLQGLIVAGALAAGLPAPLGAQKATTRDAPMATPAAQVQLDADIERLVRAMIESQRREQELARQLFATETDSVRDSDVERRRRVLLALREASGEVMRAHAQLAALCDRTPRPDGWLGISFESDARVVRRPDGTTGLRFVSYPTVAAIEPNSPAADAGVLRGDTLVMLGTVELKEREVNFTSLLRPGAKLAVTVKRDGDSKMFVVKITRRPDSYGDRCTLLDRQMSAAMTNPIVGSLLPGEHRIVVRTPMPAMAPRAPGAPTSVEAPLPPQPGEGGFVFMTTASDWFGGAELRRLNHDLADLTGADEGVFVVSVAPGSPSDAAGLKGGDVIVRADDVNLTQPADLFRAVRERDDRSVQLTVVRKKKRQVLVVRLGRR